MKYTNFGIIALVLMIALVVVPVTASVSDDDYTNKYTDVLSQKDIMSYTGHVYGNIKSGHVLDGGETFIVHNDASPAGVNKTFKFSPDGLYDDFWVPGEYTITLPQGTGSAAGLDWVGNMHPEYAHVSVKAGKDTYFTFIGNSVPTVMPEPECVRSITVLDASYCAEDKPAVTHEEYRYIITPAIPPTPESYNYVGHNHGDYDLVPAQSAYYEIVAFGSYDGKCKIAGFGQPYDFSIGMVHYKIDSHGSLKYRYHDAVPAYYTYVGHHHGDYTYTPAAPSHEAVWSAWSVSLPPEGSVSEQKTVVDESAKQGGCATGVKEAVGLVVSQGYNSFLFNNEKLPGGIFDSSDSTLLNQIDDPVYGIVKTASITYNVGCGSQDRTVTATEKELITLS